MRKECFYNMPLTLEHHFEDLAHAYENVKELYSLWILLRKKIEDKLTYSRSVFVTYSLHDVSHSRSIIQAIERFLGDERIERLSATDTFMILICAYAHDYGMSLTFEQIYAVLGSAEFSGYIEGEEKRSDFLENEDADAVHKLFKYIHEEKKDLKLSEIYFCIVLVLESYLRRDHWKGVKKMEEEIKGLLEENIKGRFVCGLEGIVEICMCHGQTIKELLKMPQRADGMVGDEYHPKFVAAMLRLGDLLDLDNGRFPQWFIKEVSFNTKLIPQMSILHYQKHEAVSHLLITNEKIEIVAKCYSENNGYKVAGLVNEWTDWLKRECQDLVLNWDNITQPDFGRPPTDVKVEILVDGCPYISEEKNFKMRMSQERVMNLLEGTSIYSDKYVGIREMIQNSIDASLLQLWSDIMENRYCSFGITKDMAKSGMDILDFIKDDRTDIFGNYDISLEVIQEKDTVSVILKDKGIGIKEEEVKFIADIGSSKEKNKRVQKLMENMPEWMKPAGFFGIGLQSVFQLTDCIVFYTRQHNMPEKQISLYSYGKNHGKVEIHNMPPNEDGVFKDNSVPGTSVVIKINPRKLLGENGTAIGNHFIYYDPEFDKGKEPDMIFAEISRACEEKLKEIRYDYFNINFISMKTDNGKIISENKQKYLRKSFFYRTFQDKQNELKKILFGRTLNTFCGSKSDEPFRFNENMACYWDKDSNRFYHLVVSPCTIIKGDKESDTAEGDVIYLPRKVANSYKIQYKFNALIDSESIYQYSNRFGQKYKDFMQLNVLIMDDQVTRYLNIDRDRLRDGAITEKELQEVRIRILEKWCQNLCEDKNKESFLNITEILASLILVFYQNVSEKLFQKFLEKNRDQIDKISNMNFARVKIPFAALWKPESVFQVVINNIPIKMKGKDELSYDSKSADNNCINLSVKTVKSFPDSLIYMQSISYDGIGEMKYQFQLRGPGGETEGICMNDAARFYDYFMAFDTHKDGKKCIDYKTVQKKVLKPDSEYPDLILSCYPHTFQRGKNFSTGMDYMIERYILSPFDEKFCVQLSKLGSKNEGDANQLIEIAEQSIQLKKCVDYVFYKRFSTCVDEKEVKETIYNEYSNFIRRFVKIVLENIDIIRNFEESE